MKVAVSIPDDVFAAGERLVGRVGASRSAVYAAALRAFVARHDATSIRAAIDAVVAAHGAPVEPGVAEAGRAILRRVEWQS